MMPLERSRRTSAPFKESSVQRSIGSYSADAPGLPGPWAGLLGVLGFPWFVHAAVVSFSALGAKPLASRAAAWTILVLGVAFALGLAREVSRVRGIPEKPSVGLGPSEAIARFVTVTAALAFVFALGAAITFPVVAYDALAYRVPVVADWLDAGRVAWVATDDPVRNGYPLGQEAVSAVVAAATGSMRFVSVTSFFHVAAGAIGIALLAENAGVRRDLARAGGALFVLAPMVILNAPSGYVDAAFAGEVIALLCTVTLVTEGSAPRLGAVAAGMAAAHVLALKSTGLPFVALVAMGAAVRAWVYRRRRPRTAAALLFATPGAFWALRNLYHTGNPLWPAEIRVIGITLWPGPHTLDQLLDAAHNTPPELAPLGRAARIVYTWFAWKGPAMDFDHRLAGLGWAWPFFALPAIGSFLWRCARSTDAEGNRQGLFVIALTGACFALQPMSWWPRYTLWVWGAGALTIALEAERVLRSDRKALLPFALAALAGLLAFEGGIAVAHANGALGALARPGQWSDLRDLHRAANATAWVDPAFWRLGLERERNVCRGAWKMGTDNANLDGVFAQLMPRPKVHVVSDDDVGWKEVRHAWQESGCRELLLLQGSPALPLAARDPTVSVASTTAFDPLFVVRLRDADMLGRAEDLQR